MENLAGLISTILLTALSIFQLALAFGLKQGNIVMGGRYPKVLPNKMRAFSAMASTILIFTAYCFASKSGIIESELNEDVLNGLIIFFTAYLGLNTLGNIASKSKKERLIMTPISLVIFLCGLVMIL